MVRPVLNLKQFIIRQQVLKLYKEILRTIKDVPEASDRKELVQWARNDFKASKHHTDEYAIKSLITYGERCLKELKQNLELSK